MTGVRCSERVGGGLERSLSWHAMSFRDDCGGHCTGMNRRGLEHPRFLMIGHCRFQSTLSIGYGATDALMDDAGGLLRVIFESRPSSMVFGGLDGGSTERFKPGSANDK